MEVKQGSVNATKSGQWYFQGEMRDEKWQRGASSPPPTFPGSVKQKNRCQRAIYYEEVPREESLFEKHQCLHVILQLQKHNVERTI